MTATTTTTIQGVSVLSRQKKRGTDVFELALSHDGIEVRRPGRPVQQMTWDRVAEWEIEERKGYVLLTLRGRGATTPLIVPGWSLDDLEILMRNITSDAVTYRPAAGQGPVVGHADTNGTATAANGTGRPAAAAATVAPAQPKSRPKRARTPAAEAVVAPAAAPAAVVAPPAPTPAPAATQKARPPSRAERRQQPARQRRTRRPFAVTWKAVVTVALLGVLVGAVTIVLLQSAGIINWSFLGPIA